MVDVDCDETLNNGCLFDGPAPELSGASNAARQGVLSACDEVDGGADSGADGEHA
jgi:hypothetical protein